MSLKPRTYQNSFLIAATALSIGIIFDLAAILTLNAGHLVYTLDDAYIHLALAENIWNGHYGVNANEFSAPSSSILWPFILAPFSGSKTGNYVPLIINVFAATGTLLIFNKVITLIFSSGGQRNTNVSTVAIIFVLLMIPATNMLGLIFTGMEHSLQVFFAALIIWGLIYEIQNRKVARWLVVALILAPLIRYENFAVSLAALLYLYIRGYHKVSVVVLSALIALVGGFSVFLMKLGLGPLPVSVLAKSSVVSSGGDGKIFLENLQLSVDNSRGILLIVGMLLLCCFVLFGERKKERLLAGCIIVSIILHLVVGRYGWYGRYEIYVWVVTILTILYLSREWLLQRSVENGAYTLGISGSLFVIFLCIPYNYVLITTPIAANNIYEQQYQMHRFAVEYYGKPVAVNDLGYVSYLNQNYVLDLWGLASIDALNYRKLNRTSDWLDVVSKAHDVRLAMIYESWFRNIPDHWQKIGELHLGKRRVTPADSVVSFYAVDEDTFRQVRNLIKEFRHTLPKGVEFITLEESQ